MNRARFLLVLLPLLAACGTAPKYPQTRKGDQIDDYHGTKVADPYRWLEDADSAETRRWIRDQNRVTSDYLKRIPWRDRIRARIQQLWDYEKFGVPFTRGGRYFYTKNDGLQNQSVLYTTKGKSGRPRILINPNKLSEDGTVSTGSYTPTKDGRYLAYSIQRAGSDWREWKIRDVITAKDLPDHLEWTKFTPAAWLPDGSGFYYGRYPKPESGTHQAKNENYKLYFHARGTAQSEDRLVYENPDQPKWGFWPEVTEDGRYLVITVWQGSQREAAIYYQDLEKGGEVVKMLPDFDADYTFLGNDGTTFWFKTDAGASNGRIVGIDCTNPIKEAWQEIVPEQKEAIEEAKVVGEDFLVSYLKDARTVVKLVPLAGGEAREIALPGMGTANGFTGRRGDGETFYRYMSFTYPAAVFRFEFAGNRNEVFRRPKVDFDPADYEVRQVFYPSRDGTKIPMFITHRKGMKLDGSNPTYLYGYGGFNSSMTPWFSVSNTVWMELGGVYAMPNLRGGGEYGEEWHRAGIRGKKQNVFDDFIAAAEWLIEKGYTSKTKLAIGGGSNGGLLVGACMTQRPDLFGAALPAVGVMDMLRFHKFTIGWAWVSEFGSSDDAEAFPWLHAYSPLHNIKPGTRYPATLVTTADHDDRVVPAHSFKFAAALQAAQQGPKPVLIRIETKAGHGAGSPTSKRIEEVADRWAFLTKNLGIRVPASFGASE